MPNNDNVMPNKIEYIILAGKALYSYAAPG